MAEVEMFKLFALVMARFGGLMATAPFLASSNIPVQVRALFAAFVALLLTPVIPAQEATLPDAALAYATLALGEFLIGAIVGFLITILFSAIQVGGQIMDMQTGFGVLNVFNPAMGTQTPIFGFFLFLLAVLYLLVTNGHHLMIKALASTYETVPIGGFIPRQDWLLETARFGSMMFADGLMIAAPVATAMLLAYVTMGFLGRVVPQIHLLVVGFPFTIGLGLFVTAFVIGLYLQILDGMFFKMFRNVDQFIRQMG